MLKLKSIRLRNWCKVQEATLDFPDRGFVFLRGINHCASDDASQGAGKTCLGEAINRALLGQSLSTTLAAYSRDRAGDTYVDIRAEHRGHPLRVELGYRCQEFSDRKGEALRYTYASQPPIEHPNCDHTRAELTRLLGVTPEVSLWTIFLDGDRLKFNRLRQDEALSLLMQALNQPPWEVYRKRAERQRDLARDTLNQTRTRLEQLQSTATDDQENLRQAGVALQHATTAWETALERWETARAEHEAGVQKAAETVTSAGIERDRLKKEIKAAQAADAAQCGALELELSRLGSERKEAERYLSGWTDLAATDRTALRHAEAHLSQLREGKSCPTCLRPLTVAATPGQLAAETKAIEKLRAKLQESNQGKETCEQCIREVDADITKKHRERSALRSGHLDQLSQQLETAEARLASADRQLRVIERQAPPPPSDATVVAARALVAERQRQLQAQTQAREAAAAAFAQAEHAFSIAQYWVKGFSPEGIPNLVLRQTVGPLNEAAQLVSLALAGGLVEVSFSAETELASGVLKPKLVTEVKTRHGATEFGRNSKGESGFANLIIAETQTQVGRVLQRVGYRWFDEVANSLSGSARRTLYAGLRRQAHEMGLLTFVVDHHDEAASCADHVLIAEKSVAGVTTYRWE